MQSPAEDYKNDSKKGIVFPDFRHRKAHQIPSLVEDFSLEARHHATTRACRSLSKAEVKLSVHENILNNFLDSTQAQLF